MDTRKAIMLNQVSQIENKPVKVFDWDKAAQLND